MRDVFEKNEGKLSVLQIIGFWILVFGIIAFVVTSFLPPDVQPTIVALAFFVTMLGFAFAFPSLLEGNEGLSTMRIIVFMMTSVICMLLLKIGWAKASLADIELDAYWMGIIAFVFGAKATQSFFESRFATPPVSDKKLPAVGMAAVPFSNADAARLAKDQNEEFLYARFPNILEVSDAVDDTDQDTSHVVAIYLSDNDTKDIPDRLEVKMPDGSVRVVATEIIKEVGQGGIHSLQGNRIVNGKNVGSICCLVEAEVTGGTEIKVVTAGHVFSNGNAINFGGELDAGDQTDLEVGDLGSGKWFCQVLNFNADVALASVTLHDFKDYISFKGKDHYTVTDADVRKTEVTVVSNVSNPKIRSAYILDYNTAWDVQYSDQKVIKSNIIVIGTSRHRGESACVSRRGDSGGCVYEPVSGKLVGLILGGNQRFTWVLPVGALFEEFNYKLV